MEFLDVVDKNDVVVGKASRNDVFEKFLCHRVVHVLVFDSAGKMVLQKRSKNVFWCPDHWSTAAGGHVLSGEQYEAAAKRELKEELGIESQLELIGKVFYDAPEVADMFLSIYKAQSRGPFNPDKNDVCEVRAFSIDEIRKMIESGEKFHPELLFILDRYFFDGEKILV